MLTVNQFPILWSPFFSRKLCLLWSSCLLLITESISLDTSDKTTSGIISICSTIWEKIYDTLSFIALTTTSAFETLFLFILLRLFPGQLDFSLPVSLSLSLSLSLSVCPSLCLSVSLSLSLCLSVSLSLCLSVSLSLCLCLSLSLLPCAK